ncbi:MAG: DUF2905 domain-containing protein [Candidatus Gygaella obscura]|nr:DUF2905 domain-containing protein [Candidatus Gygaella obscura]
MINTAKIFIVFGLILFFIGLVVLFLSRFINVGRLPGDIFIKKGNFSFYFPLTTSIIVGIVLSIISWLWIRK